MVNAVAAQPVNFSSLTSDDGLAHNTVFSITQDHKGYMWFGTRAGLSRYDSQRIKNYYFTIKSPRQETNRINCVYAVGQQLWVGTPMGLFRYLFEEDRFVRVPLSQQSDFVAGIKQMSTGELWVHGENGIHIVERSGQIRHILPRQTIHSICEFRTGTFLLVEQNKPRLINADGDTILELTIDDNGREKAAAALNYGIYKDRRGGFWLGTNRGLLQLDEKTMTFRSVDWFDRLTDFKTWVARTMTEDGAGNMWVGSESGAVVIDSNRQTAQWYDKSFTTSPYAINDRAVYSSYVSRDGTVWIGTYFGGVNYARPVGISFNHLFPAPGGQSIAGNAVSQLATDSRHRLWMATEDAGVTVLDPASGRYTYYNRANGLSDNNIHALWIDKPGVAWVGTLWGGLNRIDLASNAITVYRHKTADSTSLSNNAVHAICRDRSNTLWVGTVLGLNILDEKTGRFRPFKPEVLGKTFIYDVREDAAGQLWIATHTEGLYRYDPNSGKLTQYTAENTPAIQSDQIIGIYEDSKYNIWFGSTNGGVCVWNSVLKKFIPSPVNAQLPSPTVYGVLEDNEGTYWFSTNRGLLSYNPVQKTYRYFDKSNGLPATQFNFKSSLKDEQGLLYFGSVDGLCYFDPDVIRKRVFDPPVYFTDFKLFNKSVRPDGESVLTKHIDATEELIINYAQNVITLDFVAINYLSKGTNYYTYYLEGFEPTWNPKTSVNSRTYTNLSPGVYTFHVRSFRSNGDLSPTERTIKLTITPPFWQTPYAYLIYLLLGIAALLLYRRFITFLNRQKLAVQMERVDREKSEELNQQKLNFFTFLSNEFKTPITLIMAEIDELIHSNRAWQADTATNYGVIRKNAKRLHTLIDQITELRKTGNKSQKVQLTEADIIAFVKETVQGFAPLLQARHISKRLVFSDPYLMASFDAGKLEMILGNILFFLSNELAEGNELHMDVAFGDSTDQPENVLTVLFFLNEQPDLFEQLKTTYQVAEQHEELFRQNDSYNIGLLLTFSLFRLMPKAVHFIEEGEKRVLSIDFPIQKSPVSRVKQATNRSQSLATHIITAFDEVGTDYEPVHAKSDETALPNKPTILIIDKSKDLSHFLKRHFIESYRVLTPGTFGEALSKAQSTLPELILCDSDMYDKDNQSLCTVLKENPLTQTIPIILLLNDDDEKTILAGLNSGADGYISKPFNLKELDLLILNHLKSVSAIKSKLVSSLASSVLTRLPQHNRDQEFVLRFHALVSQHYKGKEVTADLLAQLMNCSRSQLHAKIRTFTNLSPKEYLNNYRLNLARQLLESGMSVAEVAFEVGFGNPDYFGRAFKKKFGMNPKAVSQRFSPAPQPS